MKPADERPPPATYYRCNKVEALMLEERIELLYNLLTELNNAFCNAERDLVLDTAGLAWAARVIAIKVPEINHLVGVIVQEGTRVTRP